MPRASAQQKIGIDVGGTFTDLVLLRRDGSIRLDKTPTTTDDQSRGVMNGLVQLAASEGVTLTRLLRDTSVIVHGTTTADNTMITLSGAVTGLITSAGHRDELELRRGFKESIWDPALPPPPPICPRRRRIGVPERLDFEGNVVEPLDELAVSAACRRLAKQDVESVAVCTLFSFVNPAHERRIREIVAEEMPGVDISLSHEVHMSAPEFERTSTTVVNAYVGPRIKRYLRRLRTSLAEAGFTGALRIAQSNGGMMTVDYVERRAVAVLGSGPTGGVTAACHLGELAGVRDFIGVDMGGTSYDVSVVRDGAAEVKAGWNWHHRYLVALPMVEVYSVGAGGGSIAQVNAGALSVGPASAGADPGPICYGRGGTKATVTDANLLLGLLNPETFCNGALPLRRDGVEEAFRRDIGKPLGLDAIEAAHGVFRLVNANMANAVRRVSAQRGLDPRQMALIVFGGNGAVHAGMQAEDLGIHEILVPRSAPAPVSVWQPGFSGGTGGSGHRLIPGDLSTNPFMRTTRQRSSAKLMSDRWPYRNSRFPNQIAALSGLSAKGQPRRHTMAARRRPAGPCRRPPSAPSLARLAPEPLRSTVGDDSLGCARAASTSDDAHRRGTICIQRYGF